MENIEYLLTNDEFINDIQALFDFDIHKLPKNILVKLAKAVESNSIEIEDILADAAQEGILDVQSYMSFGNVEFGSHGLTPTETKAFIDGLIGIALKQQTKLESVVSSLSSFTTAYCKFINASNVFTLCDLNETLLDVSINNTKQSIRTIKSDIENCQYDLDNCKFYQFMKRIRYETRLDMLNAELKRYNSQLKIFINQHKIVDNLKLKSSNLRSEYLQNTNNSYHNIQNMRKALSQGGAHK